MTHAIGSITMRPDIICVRITNRFTGQSKTLSKDEVDLIPVGIEDAVARDESRTRATKQLFDSEKVTELYRVQQRLRTWLMKNTVPSSLGESIYAVRRSGVGRIQAKIDEALTRTGDSQGIGQG